jgi:hypothetical protein
MANFHHGQERGYNLTTPKSRPQHQHANPGPANPKMKVWHCYAPVAPTTANQLNRFKIKIAIQRDAKDPQLLANLNRLGPVRVDHHHHHHHHQTFKTVSFYYLFILFFSEVAKQNKTMHCILAK